MHTLLSSHLSNLRIDVVASKGDFVVTYEEKTLILWDMNAGVQKATFNADKVGTSLLRRGLLLCPREVGRGKTDSARVSMGREKRGSSLLPSSTARLPFFKLLLVLMQYPSGAYQRRGVSNHFGDSHRVTGYQVKFIYLFIYFLYSLLTT